MPRYVPPSIEDYGGIKPFLEATKIRHNDYGYDDLVKNWRWGKNGMSIAALAIMFDVSWSIMSGYLKRLHREKRKPWPR